MPRPLLALLLVAGGLGLTAQQGLTGSNSVPESTAVYRATTVTGATAVSVDYTVTAGTITAVTARLQKVDLPGTKVNAAFGGDVPVLCAEGLVTIVDVLRNVGQADYTCTGFTERAERPRRLTITAS